MDPSIDDKTSRAKAAIKAAWRNVRYLLLRATGPRGRRSTTALVLGLTMIVTWQWGFALHDAKIDSKYQNTAASGMHNEAYFVYFLWYENLFPVASQAA